MNRAVVTVLMLTLAGLGAPRAIADEPAQTPAPTSTTTTATAPTSTTTTPTTPTAPTTVASRPAAPPFSLKDHNGQSISLAALKGKVVLVNFWATWCAPCLQELPFLEQFHQKRGKDGLVVIAIATDGPETAASIATVVRRRRLTMTVAHDQSGTVISSLNPRAANPYTLFIDRQGRVAHRHEGYSPGDERKYEALIDALLAER